jgi:GNAT superfamily N-acetyltransferase
MDQSGAVRIRQATFADIPAIARVHLASWQTAYRGILPDDYLDRLMDGLPRRIARWEEGMRNPEGPGTATFLAEDPAAGIVGFAGAGGVRKGEIGFSGELYAIYLLAEHRRRGLGQRLFRRCVEHVRGLGHADMMLWVIETNHGSRRFYEAMGGAVVPGAAIAAEIAGLTLSEIAYGWRPLPGA